MHCYRYRCRLSTFLVSLVHSFRTYLAKSHRPSKLFSLQFEPEKLPYPQPEQPEKLLSPQPEQLAELSSPQPEQPA